jgi:hypothetical protein
MNLLFIHKFVSASNPGQKILSYPYNFLLHWVPLPIIHTLSTTVLVAEFYIIGERFEVGCPRNSVNTEFHQHGIPYIFVTSVYSECHIAIAIIPNCRNSVELYGVPCHRMRPNSAEFCFARNFA